MDENINSSVSLPCKHRKHENTFTDTNSINGDFFFRLPDLYALSCNELLFIKHWDKHYEIFWK